MYWIYLLENQNDKGWYIGYTSNLKQRITNHQAGIGGKTTSQRERWKLIYCEGYVRKEDAMGRERYLKSGSGRTYLKKQMKNYLSI